MTDDIEALVRHAAEVVPIDPYTVTILFYWARDRHDKLDNWIREHVEGWLLERGFELCKPARGFCWFDPQGDYLVASHESRTTAALKALKEATDA